MAPVGENEKVSVPKGSTKPAPVVHLSDRNRGGIESLVTQVQEEASEYEAIMVVAILRETPESLRSTRVWSVNMSYLEKIGLLESAKDSILNPE